MKTFNYKKGKAVIRTLKEPVIKKKKLNFDRAIYFIIIIGLVVWLSSFIYNKTLWLEGNGQMLMEKVDVNFTNDVRLKEIFINEGDTVSKGSKLFNYFQNDFDSDASIVLKNFDRKEKQNNSLQELERQINNKKIRLRSLKERLSFLDIQEKKITKLVLLDVYTKTKLDDLLTQKMLLKNQIQIQRSELHFLLEDKKLIQPDIPLIGTNRNYQNTYISPIKGVVGQILKSSEEACYKTENV